jgi:1,4-alpha-glucan branching enzyme
MIKKVNKQSSDRVKVTFVLPEDHPYKGDISVVGDFNDWTPGEHRLIRRSNHTFSTNVLLPEDGRYAFRYYSEEDGWIDEDEADDYEPNEFGSTNCIVST